MRNSWIVFHFCRGWTDEHDNSLQTFEGLIFERDQTLVIVFWFWPQGLKWAFDSISVSSGHCCGPSGLRKHDIDGYEYKGIYREDSSWKKLPFRWIFQDSFYFPLSYLTCFLKKRFMLGIKNLQKTQKFKEAKRKSLSC